jgi:hypothetical protein
MGNRPLEWALTDEAKKNQSCEATLPFSFRRFHSTGIMDFYEIYAAKMNESNDENERRSCEVPRSDDEKLCGPLYHLPAFPVC